jgi:amino acid transporter
MGFLIFLAYILPALGLFKYLDYLVKTTKAIEEKPRKYLYYLLQAIVGIIALYLFYKAAIHVSNDWGRGN